MNTVKISIDPENPALLPEGRVDFNRLDATYERDIAAQQHIDETNAMLDMKAERDIYPLRPA